MVPGDTIQRSLTLTRSSDTEAFGSVKLTTSRTTSNLLTSDATNGLQLKVEQCSVAWTKVGDDQRPQPAPGPPRPVVAQRAVVATPSTWAPATSTSTPAGAASNLRITLALPEVAGQHLPGPLEHHQLHLRRHAAHREGS